MSEGPGRELDSVVGVNDATKGRCSCAERHLERIHHECRILPGIDPPTDDLPATRVKHCHTEHLSFPRGMLCDVRDPELMWCKSVEFSMHEIISGSHALQPFHSRRTGEPVHSTFRHQYRDQPTRTRDLHSNCEFSMNATVSVRSAGGRADFMDQARESLPAQLLGARWVFSIPVVALTGDTSESATSLYGRPGIDETIDHRVRPFGSTRSSPESHLEARSTISRSCSSCLIRPRAARKLRVFAGRSACTATIIDIVLTKPVLKRDLVHTEIGCGLLDRSAIVNERDRTFTELWWVGAWHVGEPFVNPID